MPTPTRSDNSHVVPVYSRAQRHTHWWVAALVALQYSLQAPMRAAMLALEQAGSLTAMQFLVSTVHVWGGTAIAVLALYRLQLRRRHPVPVAAGGLTAGAAFAVALHHRLLYVALLLMAGSGALNYYAIWSPAARWHELGKWCLLGLVGLHVLGALWHHAVRRDTVLRRMLSDRQRTDTMGG